MSNVEVIALTNALIGGLDVLVPRIQELFKSGEISAADQQAIRDKYLALRNQGDAAFVGPEWDVAPDRAPSSPPSSSA